MTQKTEGGYVDWQLRPLHLGMATASCGPSCRHSPAHEHTPRAAHSAAPLAPDWRNHHGTVGGFVGLIVGLFAYAPTALFAVIEVGLPATIAGAVIGPIVGSLILAFRRLGRLRRP